MDLRLLSYFLAVFDAGSMSAAARELRIGQPSLSRQIRNLERTLGISLFTTGPKASATAAAISFAPIARDLISRAEQAEATIKSMDHKERIRLTIAGPPTTVADVIAPFIAAAGADGLLANIHEVLPNAIYRELAQYRADLVVGTSPPPAHLEYIVIGYSPILAQAEVAQYPIAIVDDNHNVRRLFDQAISEAGLSVQIAFETQSTQASQALAAANRAVCISSDDPRFNLHPLLIRVPGRKNPLSITLFCAWDPGHFAAEQIKATALALHDFYNAQRLVTTA